MVIFAWCCLKKKHSQVVTRSNAGKLTETLVRVTEPVSWATKKHGPGDSIRDLFIPKRWVGHLYNLWVRVTWTHSPSQKGHQLAELPSENGSMEAKYLGVLFRWLYTPDLIIWGDWIPRDGGCLLWGYLSTGGPRLTIAMIPSLILRKYVCWLHVKDYPPRN